MDLEQILLTKVTYEKERLAIEHRYDMSRTTLVWLFLELRRRLRRYAAEEGHVIVHPQRFEAGFYSCVWTYEEDVYFGHYPSIRRMYSTLIARLRGSNSACLTRLRRWNSTGMPASSSSVAASR